MAEYVANCGPEMTSLFYHPGYVVFEKGCPKEGVSPGTVYRTSPPIMGGSAFWIVNDEGKDLCINLSLNSRWTQWGGRVLEASAAVPSILRCSVPEDSISFLQGVISTGKKVDITFVSKKGREINVSAILNAK